MIVECIRADFWGHSRGSPRFVVEIGDRLEVSDTPSEKFPDSYQILNIDPFCLIDKYSFRIISPLELLAEAAE
jgi:hypothetical protein